MKLDKVVKQLRRDATANPKKAALLGLMALVAMYFWAPLAWKWFAPTGGKKTSRSGKLALILTDDPVETKDKGKTRAATSFRWEKVRQSIEKDSRMFSTSLEASWLNPFASWPALKEADADPMLMINAPAMVQPELEPKDLGLVLTGISISQRRRTATINGELYREDDFVSASLKDNPSSEVKFRLFQITTYGVRLERDGKVYSLDLAKPTLAQGDEIERHNRRRGK